MDFFFFDGGKKSVARKKKSNQKKKKMADTYRHDGLWLEVYRDMWSKEEAADLQSYLMQNISWRQGESLVRKDGTPTIRRFSQLYGEPESVPIYTVRYQGQVSHRHVLPWDQLPRLKHELMERAATIAKETFTVGIIQFYRTGKTGIDPHRDKEMVRGTMIAGISLGAERRLHMSRCAREWIFDMPAPDSLPKATSSWSEAPCVCEFVAGEHTRRILEVALPSGSLYIFRPPTNERWLHSIIKDESITEPRLSITLRNYRSTAEDLRHYQEERALQSPLRGDRLVQVDPPLFDATTEMPAALAYLHQHGLVVFRQIMSVDECGRATRLFWDFCEACTDGRIDRRDSATWTNANWPGSLGTGIFSERGIGSSDFMWYVRTRPDVLALFERYWGTSRLLCSLDGCGTFRTNEHAFSPNQAWLHADVNLNKLPPTTNLDKTVTPSVQGQINMVDVCGTETGSFCWIDGSHRVYQNEWHASSNNNKKDEENPTPTTILGSPTNVGRHYCLVPGDHALMAQPVSIFRHLPAGSFVLWDSALIHANVAPATTNSSSSSSSSLPPAKRVKRDPKQPSIMGFLGRPAPAPALRRLSAYVTMAPASSIAEHLLPALGENHVTAAKQGATTAHWPDLPWRLAQPNNNNGSNTNKCINRQLSSIEEALLRGHTITHIK